MAIFIIMTSLPVFEMPAAVNLFLFGFDGQQLFFAFLRVQELARLLGSHLAGNSSRFGFFLLLLLRGVLGLRWLIGLLLSLLLFLLLLLFIGSLLLFLLLLFFLFLFLLLGLLVLLVLILFGFALFGLFRLLFFILLRVLVLLVLLLLLVLLILFVLIGFILLLLLLLEFLEPLLYEFIIELCIGILRVEFQAALKVLKRALPGLGFFGWIGILCPQLKERVAMVVIR